MHQHQKVHYACREQYEAIVFSAALQLLEHFELPAKRDDRNMYHEHPKHWPMPERSLRQPSGKRGKGFDGLTYTVREWLKYGVRVEGPREILFGIQVMCWWHRDVWNGSRQPEDKSFADYMRWFLKKEAPHLPAVEDAMLRKLYGVDELPFPRRVAGASGH